MAKKHPLDLLKALFPSRPLTLLDRLQLNERDHSQVHGSTLGVLVRQSTLCNAPLIGPEWSANRRYLAARMPLVQQAQLGGLAMRYSLRNEYGTKKEGAVGGAAWGHWWEARLLKSMRQAPREDLL
jgi:hypothetical protein